MSTGSWRQTPFLVAPACGRVGQENRRRFWPLTPRTPRTAVAASTGWTQSWRRRTRRFASTGRPCLPGDLRCSPLGQASLPRVEQLARMRTAQSVCGSPGVLSFFPQDRRKADPLQPKLPDQGRVVGCGPSLLGQAARCGGRPWDAVPRHGVAVDQAAELRVWPNTHDPAPAFAELAGFAAKTKNASQPVAPATASVCPPAADDTELTSL